MKLIFDADFALYVFDRGELIAVDKNERWPAVTGPWGKGAAPPGEYMIQKATRLKDCKKNRPYRDKAGNVWFAKLTPTFETDRTGLGIHPDGNVPGTLGCVGVTCDDTSALFALLTTKTPVARVLYIL